MLEKDITRIFLKEFQSLYPMVSLRKKMEPKDQRADLILEVEIPRNKRPKRLICEVMAEGFPKYLRLASRQLKPALEKDKSLYPVVVAPYISEEGQKICKEEGLGYFDLSGNCLLAFDGTYVDVKGNPNRYPIQRKLKSIFKGKSSRIIRVLLAKPGRRWTMRELANETSLSIGQVFKVVARLEELDVINRENQTGIQLTRPGSLLDSWRKEYSYRQNGLLNFYSMGKIQETEKSIAEECRRQNIRYALTLFSGAGRVAPFVRYNQVFVYVDDPVAIAEKLSLKEVDSGSNIMLIKPFDEGVYYGTQVKDRMVIVNTIQLYLDLYGYRGRGEEQAEFLRSQVIKF